MVSVHLEVGDAAQVSLFPAAAVEVLAAVYLAPAAILGVLMALMFILGVLVFLIGLIGKLLGG